MNPLTKTEKDQIKKLANVQYDISRRYSYDPVKSSFYYGRSVGMGKIAKVYNPILPIWKTILEKEKIWRKYDDLPLLYQKKQARQKFSAKPHDEYLYQLWKGDVVEQKRANPIRGMAKVYNPLKHFRCSICGAEAPKSLLPHSKFAERMAWLRKHYKREHPTEFRKWYRRNPLIEGAITGLGFGAGLAASGLAVKKMLGGKNPIYPTQPYEYDLLHAEGYYYKLKPKRGWYFKNEWIGYNVSDAFVHRDKREKGLLNPRGGNMRNPRAKCPYCGVFMHYVKRPKGAARLYICPRCKRKFYGVEVKEF